MARALLTGAWRYNRHDRKRGTEPPEFICRNRDCAMNLHDCGIIAPEGFRYVAGYYSPGAEPGSADITVTHYTGHRISVECAECHTEQPHLHLGEIYFDRESIDISEKEEWS